MTWISALLGFLLAAALFQGLRVWEERQHRRQQASQPLMSSSRTAALPAPKHPTDDPLALALLDTHRRIQRRMASDLHDGVHQNLAGIAMLLGSLSNQLSKANPATEDVLHQAAGKLDRLVGMVHDTQQLAEHRTLSHKADQRIPGDLFPDALGHLAKNIETFFAIESKVRGTLPDSIRGDLAGHLYRIAEEAAYNAVRHGAAKTVIFGLELDGDEAILTIDDDGHGITDDRDPTGRGLHLMALRCSKFEGQLDVRPQHDGGTRVTCRWPWPNGQGDGPPGADTTRRPQTPEDFP